MRAKLVIWYFLIVYRLVHAFLENLDSSSYPPISLTRTITTSAASSTTSSIAHELSSVTTSSLTQSTATASPTVAQDITSVTASSSKPSTTSTVPASSSFTAPSSRILTTSTAVSQSPLRTTTLPPTSAATPVSVYTTPTLSTTSLSLPLSKQSDITTATSPLPTSSSVAALSPTTSLESSKASVAPQLPSSAESPSETTSQLPLYTSSYSLPTNNEHCTCNINLRDLPIWPSNDEKPTASAQSSSGYPETGSTNYCSPDDALKIQVQNLETDFTTKVNNLTEKNVNLQKALADLHQEVAILKIVSSELKCARNSALSIEKDVRDLLNNIFVNGSDLQPKNCIPVVALSTDYNYNNTIYPRDCLEVLARNQSSPGVYDLQADGSTLVFQAYCEDGWTVIQKHTSNSEDFEQAWDYYLMGFGTPDGDYWMGLEHVHFMTSQNNYTLRTNMTGWTGKSYWAQYDVFSVATEQDNYALVAMGYKGNYKDGLSTNGTDFSTKDMVNFSPSYDCANDESGWWKTSFNCKESYTNLNGIVAAENEDSMSWAGRSVKSSVMKIIPTVALQYAFS